MTDSSINGQRWTAVQKIVFRFFLVYFFVYATPWDLLRVIPGAGYLLDLYQQAFDWAVVKANATFFRVFGVNQVERVYNGSGDTSFDWAANCFILSLAALAAVIWSVLDRKKANYTRLNYLLCLTLRFSLAVISFSYGLQKVFALQMPFPNNSQLATPLGDLLPMRFSWMFIGYSKPYEIFSGVLEVVAALLLVYRRTATMGVMVATAVFINVMMLNLCYDIPVKLFSMNLVLMCLYLLANEFRRICSFFVLNTTAGPCGLYTYVLEKKWMRITRIVLKLLVFANMGESLYSTIQYARESSIVKEHPIFKNGVYEVTSYQLHADSSKLVNTDSLLWKDLIIDRDGYGSVATKDSSFRMRYGRGYFNFSTDSVLPVITLKKNDQATAALYQLRYDVKPNGEIFLTGTRNKDSVLIRLIKSVRSFPLAERQFHWLSEANR